MSVYGLTYPFAVDPFGLPWPHFDARYGTVDDGGIYVAHDGNDANNGTRAAPVRTIARANVLRAATPARNIYLKHHDGPEKYVGVPVDGSISGNSWTNLKGVFGWGDISKPEPVVEMSVDGANFGSDNNGRFFGAFNNDNTEYVSICNVQIEGKPNLASDRNSDGVNYFFNNVSRLLIAGVKFRGCSREINIGMKATGGGVSNWAIATNGFERAAWGLGTASTIQGGLGVGVDRGGGATIGATLNFNHIDSWHGIVPRTTNILSDGRTALNHNWYVTNAGADLTLKGCASFYSGGIGFKMRSGFAAFSYGLDVGSNNGCDVGSPDGPPALSGLTTLEYFCSEAHIAYMGAHTGGTFSFQGSSIVVGNNNEVVTLSNCFAGPTYLRVDQTTQPKGIVSRNAIERINVVSTTILDSTPRPPLSGGDTGYKGAIVFSGTLPSIFAISDSKFIDEANRAMVVDSELSTNPTNLNFIQTANNNTYSMPNALNAGTAGQIVAKYSNPDDVTPAIWLTRTGNAFVQSAMPSQKYTIKRYLVEELGYPDLTGYGTYALWITDLSRQRMSHLGVDKWNPALHPYSVDCYVIARQGYNMPPCCPKNPSIANNVLSWGKPFNNVSYEIRTADDWRFTQNVQNFTVSNANATSAALPVGTRFAIIRAVNATGVSQWSSVAVQIEDIQPPSNVVVSNVSSGNATIAWTDNSTGEQEHQVQIGTPDFTTVYASATVSSGTNSRVFANLPTDTLLRARVRAVGQTAQSAYVSSVSFTTVSVVVNDPFPQQRDWLNLGRLDLNIENLDRLIPRGGRAGQALVKQSDAANDYGWGSNTNTTVGVTFPSSGSNATRNVLSTSKALRLVAVSATTSANPTNVTTLRVRVASNSNLESSQIAAEITVPTNSRFNRIGTSVLIPANSLVTVDQIVTAGASGVETFATVEFEEANVNA